jgi:nucleoside-diphosphate-sugar epimerase
MQLKVFLTGATGYIGAAIADALLAAGNSVVGLARSDTAANKLSAQGVTPLLGDLTSPAALGKAAAESDGVIHAGTTNDGSIDREAIRVLLDALRGSAKPLIYTSGIWVLGDTGGQVADETWPVNPSPLVAWRPGVEQLVLSSAGIVIRPGVVYGRGGGIPADLVKTGRYVGTGENRWPVIHVDDLADLYLSAFQDATPGTLIHATDGSRNSVREIAEAASPSAQSWPLEEARKTLGAFADALVLDQLVTSRWHRPASCGAASRSLGLLDDLRHGSYSK